MRTCWTMMRTRPTRPAKNEDEDAEGDVKGEDDEDETPRDDAILLQDLRNSLEATFRQPTRKLRVKNMLIGFDPATVFGKREQFLPALLITVTCQRFYVIKFLSEIRS